MRKFALCALLTAATVFGADFTGNWKGMAFRSDGSPYMDVLLMIKQKAEQVNGTIGPSEDEQISISNAKVDGDKITFDVVSDEGTYKLKMAVSGDDLKGSAIRSLDGQDSQPIKVELKRSK